MIGDPSAEQHQTHLPKYLAAMFAISRHLDEGHQTTKDRQTRDKMVVAILRERSGQLRNEWDAQQFGEAQESLVQTRVEAIDFDSGCIAKEK